MSARIIHLPSGRVVVDTGKVHIGLRHYRQPGTYSLSADQERLQAALLQARPEPERLPRPTRTERTLKALIVLATVAAIASMVWAVRP